MKAYKGFNKDMTCRGFRFEEGKTYEEQEAVLCEKGFHACENPLDVFRYYSPADLCEYHEVELEETQKSSGEDDSKVCGKKITIGAKLGVKGLVEAFVQIITENTKKNNVKNDGAKIGSSGYSAHIGSSGGRAKIGSSGNNAHIGSTGDSAKIGSSGNWTNIEAQGKNSVIVCAGNGCKVKAAQGDWITLAEWEVVDGEYTPVCVKTVRVDGETIKADTWYTLKDGEFAEVDNAE